jgi:superfamily II DNA or RNA helicase
MKLRPHQDRAVGLARAAYQRGSRAVLLVLPCGAGKTATAAWIMRALVERGKRALFGAHRTELIDQTVRTLRLFGVDDVRIIQADRDEGRPDAPVIVGSIDTLTTDRWLAQMPRVDMLVIDEAHHSACDSWRRVIAAHPEALLLGLTATPARADDRPLDMFDEIAVGATVAELTSLGLLVPCRVWHPTTDLAAGYLAADPVASYLTRGLGAPAIAFAGSVKHAREVAAAFTAAGISSDVVTGRCSDYRRADALARFAAGETRLLASVGVILEGFDCPSATVGLMLRRFGHASPYLQAAGRVLRPAPGKTQAVLIDLAGSSLDHGPPDLDRQYSLTGKGILPAVRMSFTSCRVCGSVFVVAAACPHCGTAVEARKARLPKNANVGLADGGGGPVPKREYVVTMVAKRGGTCARCGRGIRSGERIFWATLAKVARHERCPAALAAEVRP